MWRGILQHVTCPIKLTKKDIHINFSPVCLTPGNACDPLIEDALGLFNEVSKEERNLAKINEINKRVPPPSWLAAPTSLLDDSFSEVLRFSKVWASPTWPTHR